MIRLQKSVRKQETGWKMDCIGLLVYTITTGYIKNPDKITGFGQNTLPIYVIIIQFYPYTNIGVIRHVPDTMNLTCIIMNLDT